MHFFGDFVAIALSWSGRFISCITPFGNFGWFWADVNASNDASTFDDKKRGLSQLAPFTPVQLIMGRSQDRPIFLRTKPSKHCRRCTVGIKNRFGIASTDETVLLLSGRTPLETKLYRGLLQRVLRLLGPEIHVQLPDKRSMRPGFVPVRKVRGRAGVRNAGQITELTCASPAGTKDSASKCGAADKAGIGIHIF